MFSIQNYSVRVDQRLVVKNCNLTLSAGSVHVLMGPNGSGKSSLVLSLMGHPLYEILDGKIIFYDQNLTMLSTQQRAEQGLFLAVQHPVEIAGLQVLHFLQELCRVRKKLPESPQNFLTQVSKLLEIVGLPESILSRSVNVGFSGGEKKRFELLQLLLLEPSVVMLDEIDSGVDVDGLKMIAQGLTWYKQQNPNVILFFVTHYRKIVDYVQPDFVHVMMEGEIVRSGDAVLLDEIEKFGYEPYAKRS
ncbi:Fe-S cluster assembly ATPase SufC [candidate division TM6 bacterium RIFCSPHIGHO2_12_FULL_38_8]|nr:MAG: Fe-S cluster assembly ATPase SufC [candidate division TM6 bacterium RIFCSPHIGHO2_12_FULL_38_8]